MIKIRKFFLPLLLFLSTSIFVSKNTNSTHYVYDKYLIDYEYYLKLTSLILFHKVKVCKWHMCICAQITNTKEL